jgi:hypothetical protein
MENPRYLVNIYYQPQVLVGQQAVFIGGITQSIPAYRDGYFVASMPEIKIVGTGSSYQTALSNLLLIATASSTYDNGNGPLNLIRFS